MPSAPLVTAIPFSAMSTTTAFARLPFSSSCFTSRFDGLPSMRAPLVEAGSGAQPTARPERISRDASADQPRRAVPGAGELKSDRPRGRSDDPRSLDHGIGRPEPRGHQPTDRGAAAVAAPTALEARRGPVRARLPLLARRRALRPRLPRPRAGASPWGGEGKARRAGGADRLAAARPRPTALGGVPDPRTRERPQGAPDQDSSFDGRRALRCGDHGRALRLGAVGARAAGARCERRGSAADRAGNVDPRPDGAASLPASASALPPERSAKPRRVSSPRQYSRHQLRRQGDRPALPDGEQPGERGPRTYALQG